MRGMSADGYILVNWPVDAIVRNDWAIRKSFHLFRINIPHGLSLPRSEDPVKSMEAKFAATDTDEVIV